MVPSHRFLDGYESTVHFTNASCVFFATILRGLVRHDKIVVTVTVTVTATATAMMIEGEGEGDG